MDTASSRILDLSAHPFLSGLRPNHLERLQACAAHVRFPVGESLLRRGATPQCILLLLSGCAYVTAHVPGRGELIVDIVREGGAVGWSWIVPEWRWQFDADAIEPIDAIALDAACVRAACDEDATLGYELMRRVVRVVAHRLHFMTIRLVDAYAEGAGERPDERTIIERYGPHWMEPL